ncbi:MAG: glycosyl transferase [Dactylosporangium sp.]|nr:hypothetical protein [Dactylosporangium sp.]NNJ59649.1 glycosyl transferase [Dactylosporangium sp.]
MARHLRIAVAIALQDAGEVTRALELTSGLRECHPPGWSVDFTFLTHGSRFEPLVRQAGHDLMPCDPRCEGRSVTHDLQWDPPQVVGSVAVARDLISGERAALAELRPDAVLHGFWPFANLASRMLGIPVMAFLPIPLHPTSMAHGLFRDLPEHVPVLARLPRPVRRAIVTAIPPGVKRRFSTQPRIGQAAAECGWSGQPPQAIFEMLAAGVTVINDLPEFYTDCRISPSMAVTGAVYAPERGSRPLSPEIRAVLDPSRDVPTVFCTMGSSGTRDALLTAAKAVAGNPSDRWNAVILAAPAVCPLAEVNACVVQRAGVVVTDAFVPAATVNRLADVVVSHGGQGTVQTAMASATPIVGVAMQAEQQINLDHVAERGAGIRVPARQWRVPVIREAIHTVLREPSYRLRAAELAATIRSHDGRQTAAEHLWRFLQTELAG